MMWLQASLLLLVVAGDITDAKAPRMLRPAAEPDFSPLMVAAYSGHERLAKGLLATGVGVDATDTSGVTALMLAVFSGKETMVRTLLSAGANVDARDKEGRTALMVAAYRGDVDVARRLLQAGALVAAESREGVTAGMLAFDGGHSSLSALLTAAGTQRLVEAADLTSAGSDGSARYLVDALHAAKAVGVEKQLIGHAEKRLFAAVQGGHGGQLLAQLRIAIDEAVEAGQVGEMNRLNDVIDDTLNAIRTHRPVDHAAVRAAAVRRGLLESGRTSVALALVAPTTAWFQGFLCAFPVFLSAWAFYA